MYNINFIIQSPEHLFSQKPFDCIIPYNIKGFTRHVWLIPLDMPRNAYDALRYVFYSAAISVLSQSISSAVSSGIASPSDVI